MIAVLVYLLCAVTSMLCAGLLLRSYLRKRSRLFLWTSLGFAGIAASNLMLFIDLVVYPEVPLLAWRTATLLVGVAFLLYGLIWDTL
jgi:hypothetical protein